MVEGVRYVLMSINNSSYITFVFSLLARFSSEKKNQNKSSAFSVFCSAVLAPNIFDHPDVRTFIFKIAHWIYIVLVYNIRYIVKNKLFSLKSFCSNVNTLILRQRCAHLGPLTIQIRRSTVGTGDNYAFIICIEIPWILVQKTFTSIFAKHLVNVVSQVRSPFTILNSIFKDFWPPTPLIIK